MHSHNNDNSDPNSDDAIDLIDMMGMPCEECARGLYEETTVNDDKEGVLHCDKCNDLTKRYVLPEDLYGEELEDEFNGEDKMEDLDAYFAAQDYSKEDMFSNFYAKTPVKKCTDSHPPLPLTIDGKEVVIYGSSCIKPIVKDADLYISLDYNAPVYYWEQPWYVNDGNKQHIRYFIDDMSLPDDKEDFKDLVNFTIHALANDKKVHAGCIAGHGRTGTLLAAITQETMGDRLAAEGISAIDYVRSNYCKKAVETLAQVLFLNAEYGVAIPNAEKSLVAEFKEMFFQQIEIEFDDIVAKGEFMATVPVIDSLERAIDLIHNPPPPKVVSKNGIGMSGTNWSTSATTSTQPWTTKPAPKFGKI
jgi:hypothetical protein